MLRSKNGSVASGEWVLRLGLIVDVGLEGDAIDDSEAEGAGVEGVAGQDGPMFKLIVAADGPPGSEVIVKAQTGASAPRRRLSCSWDRLGG